VSAIGQRWRRRQLAAASFASLAVVVFLCQGASADVGPTRTAHEVPASRLKREDADSEVFMSPQATPRQISNVRQSIEASLRIARFAYLDHRAAFREFRRRFADQPKLRRGITSSDLPVSFRLVLRIRGQVVALNRELRRLDGVSDVVSRLERSRFKRCDPAEEADLEVFMKTGATAEQLATTRAQLRADPAVVSVTLVTRADALREFRCLFAGDPDYKSVTADDLPASFRVNTKGNTDVGALAYRIRSVPGVEDVTTAS
jgi:cell division protein FtsX